MKCKTIKHDGGQCKANATHKSEFCYRHDKTIKHEALQASSEGGKARRQYNCLGNATRLKTPDDIKNLMARAINSLWTGKMPASNPAGALGYLAKIFLEAYEKSELEIRIEQLEKQMNQLNNDH